MAEAEIAFIGGSGLYDIDGLTDAEQVIIDTPFGQPSDAVTVGTLEGRRVAFLARHGKGHRHLPSEIPFRANIYALKLLGVKRIISVSAVGSLQEGIAPLDMVVPDQIIDRTRGRVSTFFGDGVAAHVGFADPFLPGAPSRPRGDGTEQAGHRPRWWRLRRDGRAAVLHSRRVEPVPVVGGRHHRNDGATGGQAGPRGGDLLCDLGVGDGLRRMASVGGRGLGRSCRREPDEERGDHAISSARPFLS